MADIVDDFLQRLAQLDPATAERHGATLEGQIRQAWGGCEPYVAKRPARVTREHRLAEALQQGQPLGQAFGTAGVSRRTGYRILKQPAR